ncbi:MAG: iron donor protein CyaY [Acidobacteria bacterium]|nr:iron donor protein CyaY [Acidobacteriota bacterium]
MEEQEFQSRCDEAMAGLYRALAEASDDYDFEADQNAGAITVEFEAPPAKFVVSPNSPVRQIWISALTRSFKLEWDAARHEFVWPQTGAGLRQLMEQVISEQLGEEVSL